MGCDCCGFSGCGATHVGGGRLRGGEEIGEKRQERGGRGGEEGEGGEERREKGERRKWKERDMSVTCQRLFTISLTVVS